MRLNDCAQAVATALGGVVDYWPEFNRAEIASGRLVVVPVGVGYTRASRGLVTTEYTISVGCLQRINSEDDLPTLVEHVQHIGRQCLDATFADFTCVNVTYDPLYAPELLREKKQFTGVIKLTLKGCEG